MTPKEVIKQAYSNVPKEPMPMINFDVTVFRGIKYYWFKLVRRITRTRQ